jgi:hypothetical protein
MRTMHLCLAGLPLMACAPCLVARYVVTGLPTYLHGATTDPNAEEDKEEAAIFVSTP